MSGKQMTEYLKQNVWKTDDGILETKTDDGILKTGCLENR